MIHRAQCDTLVAAVHTEFCNDPAVTKLKSEASADSPVPDFKHKVEALLQHWKAGAFLLQHLVPKWLLLEDPPWERAAALAAQTLDNLARLVSNC